MRQHHRLLLVAVLAVTALAYVNALDGQFVYDDNFQVLRNPTLGSLANIPKMFTQGVWQFLSEGDKSAVGPYYRPLFNIALIINHQMFGLEVFGWHLVSLLVHLGVSFLVYRVALQWKLSAEVALASALLFGLHPVHSESVAWVAALPDPLGAVFLLSSLLLYERFYHGQISQKATLGFSVLLAFLAMLSKEVAVIFPLFLVARELFDRPQGEKPGEIVKRIAKRTAPFFALVVLNLGLRYYVLGTLRLEEPKSLGVTGTQVMLTIPSVLMSYARMLFIPFPLAIIYDNTYVNALGDFRFWGAALAVIAIVAVASRLVRRSPAGKYALAFFIIFILPVLNLKAFRLDESLLHDRYLYLPSIGFCILSAMGLEALSSRFGARGRQIFATAALLIGVVFLGLTFYQNFSWQDELAMTNNALKVSPRWPFLFNKLGAYYAEQRQLGPAEQAYLATLEIDPKYYDAYSNLGDVYRVQGNLAEAERCYLKALEYGAVYSVTYYNLGVTYITEGRLADAEQPLLRAVELWPNHTKARYNLAWAYDQQGKSAMAERMYVETLERDPAYPEARINLAALLARQARYPDALEHLQIARRYAPDHPVLLYTLGDVYLKTARYQDAIAVFSPLAVRNLHQNFVHTSLGLCYENIGKKDEAKSAFQKAIEVAPDDPYTKTAREHLAKLQGVN